VVKICEIEKMNSQTIYNIFPTPVYVIKREKELSTSDMECIRIEGEKKNYQRTNKTEKYDSNPYDTHFFDTKLNSLKVFIEQNINTYVSEVITPKNKELDFYITQSWVNVLKPGENLNTHHHANSLISGSFYVSVAKGDAITFTRPSLELHNAIVVTPEKFHTWNDTQMDFMAENNLLLLWPSRMMHSTRDNPERTTDRISIAFNVFVRGVLGEADHLNELKL
jgi:uncharacterized protein (TIGR02466 family)